jgi:ATPase complex subunit ATP10
MRNNTPVQQRDTTLVYFSGSNTTPLDEFRDVLRMHNVMINYVYLLDDVGRVRFAGSGLANEEDLTRLFLCTDELMSEEKNGGNKKKNQ